jgi:flagellar motility protein MotE (MotC chaperone)
MSRAPRFLPILLIAVGGVLGVRALTGMQALPQMLAGAKALAQDIAPAPKPAKAARPKPAVDAGADSVSSLLSKPSQVQLASATSTQSYPAPPKAAPAPVCAPTPAELARQAGISPSELQVLQSLGNRRTQLDAREQTLDTQLQLLAAAEAKVDSKLKQLAGLKGDIQGLLGQADAQKQTEMARLVTAYEKMKPQDAAARMTLLDDSVRLPLASKIKVSALSAILAQMPPVAAKTLTEKLADRLTAADQARQAVAAATAPQPAPAAPAGAKPTKG